MKKFSIIILALSAAFSCAQEAPAPVPPEEEEVVEGTITTEEKGTIKLFFDQTGVQVHTSSDLEYNVETNVTWIKHIGTKAEMATATEIFELEPNPDNKTRLGRIIFRATKNKAISCSVAVSQGPRDPLVDYTKPGIYNLDGENYIKTEGGWNQSSAFIPRDGIPSYRLFNASTLTVLQIEGNYTGVERNGKCSFTVTFMDPTGVSYVETLETTLVYDHDGKYWFRSGTAQSGTGIILEM